VTQYVCLNLMKREAFNHGKMKQLCRRLDIPLWQAVGLLESIWNLTAKECPRGDIGRLSDEYICLAMDYRGDETVLMEGLIHARWIDRQETARLVIHDWYDHADDAVHRKLARAHLFFVTGEAPRLTRLAGRERQEAEQFYATHLQSAGPSFPQEGPVLWQESTEKCAQNINPGVPSAPKTAKSAPHQSPAPPEPEPEPILSSAAAVQWPAAAAANQDSEIAELTEALLRQDPLANQDTARKLLEACRAQAPYAKPPIKPAEIALVCHEKRLRNRGSTIQNPLGFLLVTVPPCFPRALLTLRNKQ
jgi:hypothetical protein